MGDFGVSEALSVAGLGMKLFGSTKAVSGQDDAANAVEAAGVNQRAMYALRGAELRRQAGQQVAASQHKGFTDATDAALMASKLIAAGGASGGSGPQIQRLVSDIIAKGSYNRAMDIYNGDEAARQRIEEANANDLAGYYSQLGANQKAAALRSGANASAISGMGAILPGAATLYERYGGGGVTTTDGVADTGGFDYTDGMQGP